MQFYYATWREAAHIKAVSYFRNYSERNYEAKEYIWLAV